MPGLFEDFKPVSSIYQPDLFVFVRFLPNLSFSDTFSAWPSNVLLYKNLFHLKLFYFSEFYLNSLLLMNYNDLILLLSAATNPFRLFRT